MLAQRQTSTRTHRHTHKHTHANTGRKKMVVLLYLQGPAVDHTYFLISKLPSSDKHNIVPKALKHRLPQLNTLNSVAIALLCYVYSLLAILHCI